MQVDLRIEGDPVPLSPGVDLAAYRIAQEGLTNALRHAQATRAHVLVRYAPGRLDVEVEDNGRGLARSRAANGSPPTAAATGWSGSASGWRCTAAPSTWFPRPPAACASPSACP